MPYIVQADLIEQLSVSKLIQLTDDEKLGVVNTDRVNRAIAKAQGVVDGYLQSRYTVPLAAPSELVKGWMIVLVKYELYQRRDQISESLEAAYKAAMGQLRDVQSGKLLLGVEPLPSASSQASSGAVYGPARIFTRDALEGF